LVPSLSLYHILHVLKLRLLSCFRDNTFAYYYVCCVENFSVAFCRCVYYQKINQTLLNKLGTTKYVGSWYAPKPSPWVVSLYSSHPGFLSYSALIILLQQLENCKCRRFLVHVFIFASTVLHAAGKLSDAEIAIGYFRELNGGHYYIMQVLLRLRADCIRNKSWGPEVESF